MSNENVNILPFNNNENITKNVNTNSDAESLSIIYLKENWNTTVTTTSQPTKLGRKRQRNEQNWKKNVTKQLRNTGQAYESATKKIIEERSIKEPCGDKCRLKCSSQITDEERMLLFQDYWALGDSKKQWNYICRSMTLITPKYRYRSGKGVRKPRQNNNAFYFELPNKQVRVCKTFFKNTLGINDRPIRTALEKQDQFDSCLLLEDNRGKHNNHKKVDESIKNGIRAHIESIPKIESHYVSNSSKFYIDGSRTILDIHKDYVEIQKQKDLPFGTYVLFYRIFTDEYNISFSSSKKDVCEVCVGYENFENKDERNEIYETHIKEEQYCWIEKARDVTMENVVALVYDLQPVFQCPKGESSLFYYKYRLNVYNCTIYDLKTNKVQCYVWDESNANGSVNDLGTCLYRYLEQLSSTYSGRNIHVILYSDNFAEQKNNIMVAMNSFAVQRLPNILSITQKYFLRGHTQNEGDTVQSLIDKQVKKVLKDGPMFTPEAYIGAVKAARKNPEPIHVNEMFFNDFYDWNDACDQMGVNIANNEEELSINIEDIKILKVEKNSPRMLYYKTSFGETEYKRAVIITKKKILEVDVKKAYDRKPGISRRKKEDLMYLVDNKLIPEIYGPFYSSL